MKNPCLYPFILSQHRDNINIKLYTIHKQFMYTTKVHLLLPIQNHQNIAQNAYRKR